MLIQPEAALVGQQECSRQAEGFWEERLHLYVSPVAARGYKRKIDAA